MRRWKPIVLVPLLGLASLQALACYTVYDRNNRVMWQGDKPPVDMSRPLSETVPVRFPGGQMVFDDSPTCPVVSSVAMGNGGFVTATNSPLLTDQKTARELRLPHRMVGENIAMVPAQAVAMEPGVTVVPSVTVASKSPDTRTMGAPGAVITEYRNPPLTVIRRGNEIIVTEQR
ncbi:hypothetical protein [Ramlibacter sp. PS4R-6]|uniref:hypothetical protein n=1 Tax=Ramlibacter sp. PS4R-6 TaxID=3133438 RepID=UPI00309C802D